MLPAPVVHRLILRMADAIAQDQDVLTRLDQAIGDGDHGVNMVRGFEALRAEAEALSQRPWAELLHQGGMTLVTSIGGAAGPLYGSLLMGMGKAAGTGAGLAEQVTAGVEAVKRRGRSDVGAKTMLDVLVPVAEAIARGEAMQQLRTVADTACAATAERVATRGRAAYLGERSRGHIDPGAASSRLLVQVCCTVLEEGEA